jgi:predicted ATPase
MTVAAEMLDGTRVPVEHLSEGFLYFLAFAALRHLDPPSLLLIEEPENGLHPARIREVVRVLRDLSRSGTQVLLTTHSPLLLNELQADEITVLTRPPGGTRATRLSEVPRYRERAENDDLLPGEFWVNYCDGELEAPLLEPVDETSP